MSIAAGHHSHGHHHEAMLSVEEARERVLEAFHVLEPEAAPILDTLGQVLAEDVKSGLDIPPLDNSAMDGYAVRSGDIGATGPATTLKVVGAIAAGQLPDVSVTGGAAVRIMTGAPVPDGADAIVPFEDTDEIERRESGRGLSEISVRVPPGLGAHVRPAGQDVRRGQTVLAGGTVVRPAEIGVMASLGLTVATVIRRPLVAVLATGDELLEPGAAYDAGKIYNSNGYATASAVVRAGGVPQVVGIAKDSMESMRAKLLECMEADLIVTTAGVSKGDYDLVKDALSRHGRVDFWSVRMRPAKPLAFGLLRSTDGRGVPLLGLPGNPVSSMVAFEQFGRPAVHKMMGRPASIRPVIKAVLDEPIHNTDGRRVFARAVVTKRDRVYHVSLTGDQGSNLLTSMARANGLAICPEHVPRMEAGQTVDVQMIDWPEEVF